MNTIFRTVCRPTTLLTCALMLPALFAHGQPSQAQAEARLFPETGKTVRGAFLQYWEAHGGLMQQGYPISEELQERSDTDGRPYTVQYFERAVFEYHPENQPPHDVLLSLLGAFEYRQKYPTGAPGQRPNNGPGSVLFKETGKRLGGRFLQYWQQNGGLSQLGYPISDEFQERSALDGKTYTVQYFERAVFEYHPQNKPPYDVLLSQLGTFRYQAKYASQQQPPSDFMRSEGVLYIQAEYYQSRGLSVWKASQPGGGPLQELTTFYEWWIDAENPQRFLRAQTEMLENGPQHVDAGGSNGVAAWWELSVTRRINTPVYHQGLDPTKAQMTFDDWISIFSSLGERVLERVRNGEAQQVGEEDRAPWGKLLIIRSANTQNGVVTTNVVRAEEPHVRVESVTKDQAGKIVQTYKLTRWEWFNTKQLDDGFWMKPPTVDVRDKR